MSQDGKRMPIELHGWVKVWSWEELEKLVGGNYGFLTSGTRIEKDISGMLCIYSNFSGEFIGLLDFSDSLAADVTGRPFIIPNWVLDAFQVKDKPLPERVKNNGYEKLRAEVDDLSEKVQKLLAKAGE